jgi:tetratricopeptide (TPR) repeat protein
LTDALQDFESIRSKRDFALGAVYGLLYFSKRQACSGTNEIESLEVAAEMTLEISGDSALVNAANLLLHLNRSNEALRLLNRMTKQAQCVIASNVHSMRASNLRGWLELTESRGGGSNAAAAERHFLISLGESESDTDALLGLAACHSARKDWEGALRVLNRAIAGVQGDQNRYNESVPCLVEKARVMANRGDWAQAEVMAHRVLDEQDRGNVCSLRLLALHAATQLPASSFSGGWGVGGDAALSNAILGESPESRGLVHNSEHSQKEGGGVSIRDTDISLTGDEDAVAAFPSSRRRPSLKVQLEQLVKAMDRHESCNVPLFLATARLFARIGLEPRHPGTLTVVLTMLNKALTAFSRTGNGSVSGPSSSSRAENSDEDLSMLLCELAYIQALVGRPPPSQMFSMKQSGTSFASSPPSLLTHKGSHISESGGLGKAMETYRKACKTNPGNMCALFGMIDCQIVEGSFDDALQQLELLKAMSGPSDTDVQLLLIEAKISFKQQQQRHSAISSSSLASSPSFKKSLELLQRAVSVHQDTVRTMSQGAGEKRSASPATSSYASSYPRCNDRSGGGRAVDRDSESGLSMSERADRALFFTERMLVACNPVMLLEMAALYLAQCSDLSIPTMLLPSSVGHGGNDASMFNFRGQGRAAHAKMGRQSMVTQAGSSLLFSASSHMVGGGGSRRSSGALASGLGLSSGIGLDRAVCAVTSDAPALRRSLALLRYVNEKLVPADVEALLLTGRATLLVDPAHPDDAIAILRRCLRMDATNSAVHLLMATVALDYCEPTNLRLAQQALDQALSFDFNVRKLPKYHILRARLLGKQGLADKALAQLQMAADLDTQRFTDRNSDRGAPGRGLAQSTVDVEDCVAVTIESVKALVSLHRFAEAKVTLCEAKKKIRGMPFETALVLCESQMLAANGDADGALHVLTALGGCSQEANTSIVVGSRLGDATIDSKTFGQIQRAKAAIHLHGRRDKVAYTQCFNELVERAQREMEAARGALDDHQSTEGVRIVTDPSWNSSHDESNSLSTITATRSPTTSNNPNLTSLELSIPRRMLHDAYEALGEAMLAIQAPSRAVEAFQSALNLDPSNAFLAVRIGRALIATHDYRRAQE